MLYWTCKYGSYHDPGERCDCEKEMPVTDGNLQPARGTGIPQKQNQFILTNDWECVKSSAKKRRYSYA